MLLLQLGFLLLFKTMHWTLSSITGNILLANIQLPWIYLWSMVTILAIIFKQQYYQHQQPSPFASAFIHFKDSYRQVVFQRFFNIIAVSCHQFIFAVSIALFSICFVTVITQHLHIAFISKLNINTIALAGVCYVIFSSSIIKKIFHPNLDIKVSLAYLTAIIALIIFLLLLITSVVTDSMGVFTFPEYIQQYAQDIQLKFKSIHTTNVFISFGLFQATTLAMMLCRLSKTLDAKTILIGNMVTISISTLLTNAIMHLPDSLIPIISLMSFVGMLFLMRSSFDASYFITGPLQINRKQRITQPAKLKKICNPLLGITMLITITLVFFGTREITALLLGGSISLLTYFVLISWIYLGKNL